MGASIYYSAETEHTFILLYYLHIIMLGAIELS